jgi:hypothetical protein
MLLSARKPLVTTDRSPLRADNSQLSPIFLRLLLFFPYLEASVLPPQIFSFKIGSNLRG